MARGPEYQLILTTDSGSRLYNPLSLQHGFKAMRKANTISPCTVNLNYRFDSKLFTVADPKEYMLQVWYKPPGGTMSLFNNYFITRFERSATPTPEGSVTLMGYDANILLYRRIVAAYAASTEARITEEADDMLKTLLTNAQSDANDPTPTAGTRAWPGLTVGEKVTAGPSLTLDLERDELLDFSGSGAFKQIVNASREAGTDLFFDVHPNDLQENSIDFMFDTYTGQIGRDLTDEITLSIGNNAIRNGKIVWDLSKAKNYIYGYGKGQDDLQTVVQSYDTDDYLRGKYTRSEGVYSAPSTDDDSLQNATDAEIYDKRRTIKVTGDITDTPQLIYGKNYNFGDLVTAQMFGDTFDAMITSVQIGLKENAEPILKIGADYRL